MRRSHRFLRIAALSSIIVGIAAALSTPLAGADDGFVQGGGDARAQLMALNLITGGITLAATEGKASSHYVGSLGQADARALDMGLFPTIFGPIGTCDGATAFLAPESLPPSTLTDSAQPDGAQSRRTAVTMPGLRGTTTNELVGYQDAVAHPGPFAEGLVDVPRGDFGFALVTENGHTDVTTQIVNGSRIGHAVVTADRMTFLGGLIVLNHPRWEATARSGAVNSTDGVFTFTDATMLGFHRTEAEAKADFTGFSYGLSNVLAALGAYIDFPKITVTATTVDVSSLTFGLRDMPLGRDTLGPLLTWFDSMAPKADDGTTTTTSCPDLWIPQVLAVTKDLLGGNGEVRFTAGGAYASTDDTYYAPLAPPVDSSGGGGVPTTAGSQVLPTVTSRTVPIETTIPSPDTTAAPTTVPDSSTTTTTIAPAGRDESVIPLPPAAQIRTYVSGHKGGRATVVALAGLGLALALFAADRFLIRRSPRSAPS